MAWNHSVPIHVQPCYTKGDRHEDRDADPNCPLCKSSGLRAECPWQHGRSDSLRRLAELIDRSIHKLDIWCYRSFSHNCTVFHFRPSSLLLFHHFTITIRPLDLQRKATANESKPSRLHNHSFHAPHAESRLSTLFSLYLLFSPCGSATRLTKTYADRNHRDDARIRLLL